MKAGDSIKKRFTLNGEFREGRLSTVYEAFDIKNGGKKVAVKLFKSNLQDNDLVLEAYQRESQRLLDLNHPSIVSMIDYGVHNSQNRPFIILEWGGDPIDEWFSNSRRPNNWDDYYEQIGRDLLEGIAFAHSRDTVHREIKPSDFLRDDDGNIRLTDFGVSKFPSFLDQTLDIGSFIKDNEPYAPENGYDSSFSYTTDVYGYAAVSLYFLSNSKFKKWKEIDFYLKQVKAPKPVRNILNDALEKNASERPLDAQVLLDKLEKANRTAKLNTNKKLCNLGLTDRALNMMRNNLPGIETRKEAETTVINDLNSICCIKKWRDKETKEVAPDKFEMFGESLLVTVAIDNKSQSNLALLNVKRLESHDLHERLRENAWESGFKFTFTQTISAKVGKKCLSYLKNELDKFEEDSNNRTVSNAEKKLFGSWQLLINLRLEHAHKGLRYEFEGYEYDENRIKFYVRDTPDPSIIEEIWCVEESFISGVVDEVKEDSITLYLQGDKSHKKIKQKGILSIDSSATKSQLSKQLNSINSIRYERSASTAKLKEKILHPSDCKLPAKYPVSDWYIENLDDTKKAAIERAISTNDFFVVEGPPGTGKTTFIAELILQYLRKFPNKRVLITSQTHIAVDNVIERMAEVKPSLEMTRIGRDEKISEAVKPYTLDNRIKVWKKEVKTKSIKFLKDLAEKDNIDTQKIQLGLDLSVLSNLKKLFISGESSEQEREGEALDLENKINEKKPNGEFKLSADEKDRLAEELVRVKDDLRDIQRSLKERNAALLKFTKEFTEQYPDDIELIELSPKELLEWQDALIGESKKAARMMNLYQLNQEWVSRFTLKDDCQEALLLTSEIVAGTCIGTAIKGIDSEYGLCILDEASKASLGESLVPMAMANNWILVGDQRQLPPFADELARNQENLKSKGIDYEIITETLLSRLDRLQIPDECKTMLVEQHRMVPSLGEMISSIFYEGKLKNNKSSFRPTPLERCFGKPVHWISTSKEQNHFEKRNKMSFVNSLEAECVSKVLARIDFYSAGQTQINKPRLQVAVITGYAAQKDQILNRISQEKIDNIDYECNTVDAYQGKEADFVIFSITRSNEKNKAGFLSEYQRINVALSRGKYGVCIVGDSEFCRNLGHATKLSDVITHIESNPNECEIVDYTS